MSSYEWPAALPHYRRVGQRMNCSGCEVAWTGSADSHCWVCDKPGTPGPPPSIYPEEIDY